MLGEKSYKRFQKEFVLCFILTQPVYHLMLKIMLLRLFLIPNFMKNHELP